LAKGALSGLRIADFSWVIAGPMATKALAGMGAEVIKIESHVRPEFVHRDPLFDVVNNSKKSVAIDLSQNKARELVARIVGQSDIVIENFSQGVMARWGLDYESVRAIRPDIIYVSGSGVGREGPQGDVLAYGSLLEAYSGRANVVCRGAINSRMEAMGIMPAWTDPATAMWEILAVLLAVHNRGETGEGAYIDLSMIESTIALLAQPIIAHQAGGGETQPGFNQEHGASPSGCFKCDGEDAWIALSIRTDTEWRAFCEAAGMPDLIGDPRFATRDGRMHAIADLNERVGAWCAELDAAYAEGSLRAVGVNVTRSRNTADIMADPQVEASGIFQAAGLSHRTTTMPWQEAVGWRGEFGPAPRLGEHTTEVLRELLDMDETMLAQLHKDSVIFAAEMNEDRANQRTNAA
jgi:benzylsuccinate CoA-transferase BbsF subunit